MRQEIKAAPSIEESLGEFGTSIIYNQSLGWLQVIRLDTSPNEHDGVIEFPTSNQLYPFSEELLSKWKDIAAACAHVYIYEAVAR